MKIKKYTLIELLAAMTIFIIMMGILFKTFTTSADVASTQTTKVEIMSDANIFFNYLTVDLKNIDVQAIEKLLDKNNAANDPNTAAGTTNEADGNKLHFNYYNSSNPISISFYSDVTPYDDNSATSYSYDSVNAETLKVGLDLDSDAFLIPDLKPYIAYELVSYTEGGASKKAIVRKMYADQSIYVNDAGTYTGATSSGDITTDAKAVPVILEGVEDMTIQVWDDYPGGSEIRTSPIGHKPACVTVSITLTNPSPTIADMVKERNKRTITKVIYLGR